MLRYHGGKWKIAPWIISHFPQHHVYCEPFGGAASVLLRKPRSYAEVYNDLDGEIVNLFSMVRDRGPALRELIRFTPFSRREYEASYVATSDPLEQARRTMIRSFMGFGSNALAKRVQSGFRMKVSNSYSLPSDDWKGMVNALDLIIERLRGVVIESRHAFRLIAHLDSPRTLFYVDPPYLPATRSVRANGHHGYNVEMSAGDHEALLEILCGLRGRVIVSGYDHPSYRKAFKGWKLHQLATMADGARPRLECLWVKP